MRRKTAIAILAAALALPVWADKATSGWTYTARLGYNIGGTAPIGMPSTIRSMNKYTLQPNFSLGLDAQKTLKGRWGVLTGLHIENKGMEVDATVKGYHMAMTQGGDNIEGYYTGNLVTEVEEWMLTVPLQATCSIGRNVTLRLGPYVSYVSTRVFKGYAYDGYLRYLVPTGQKINIGNSETTRGDYDFGEDMRRIQWGIDAGVDWQFSRRWGTYADLQWGLTGVHKSSFKTIEQTLYPIFGTFGITYKLK